MVNLPPDPGSGRFITKAECQQACQSYTFARSFSCEGDRCVLQQVAPDESLGYYATMERCKAYCQHHHSGIISYDCIDGRCREIHDGSGQSKEACQKQCRRATLFSYQCTKPSGDYGMYSCNRVNLAADKWSGRFQTMAKCQQACQSFNLKTGYTCVKGSQPGLSRCKKVAGIPTPLGSNGVFTSEADCEKSTVCGALPVNVMQEPNWAIGSVESNPLTQIMSNVGDTGDYIQNYMGSHQQNTFYRNK